MALFNVVDIFFISYVEGVDAIAALTVAFPVMTLSSAVGVGAASVISRRLGEKRAENANMVFGTSLFLILIISAVSFIYRFIVVRPVIGIRFILFYIAEKQEKVPNKDQRQ